jgi:hypothetical protein
MDNARSAAAGGTGAVAPGSAAGDSIISRIEMNETILAYSVIQDVIIDAPTEALNHGGEMPCSVEAIDEARERVSKVLSHIPLPNKSHDHRAEAVEFFEKITAVCPKPRTGYTHDVITVIFNADGDILGKRLWLNGDKIEKEAKAAVANAFAMVFYVPDHETMKAVLDLVGENTYAAVSNSGWRHVQISQLFKLSSKGNMKNTGYAENGVAEIEGLITFARLKEHATPSSWQVVDRDIDKWTPEWARSSEAEWIAQQVEKILPGFSKTTKIRTYSTSSRVIRPDDLQEIKAGHFWIKICNPADVDRVRAAIIPRAVSAGLTWQKPRFSKTTGEIVGYGTTTVIDPATWVMSRYVFSGAPVAVAPLRISPQQIDIAKGEQDELDTSSIEVDAVKVVRATAKVKTKSIVRLHVSQDQKRFVMVEENLSPDTELELADGTLTTVQDLSKTLKPSEKVRVQAPFRDSLSMAAFLALDRRGGRPFVYDSGTDIIHALPDPIVADALTDPAFCEFLADLKRHMGYLLDEQDDALAAAIINIGAMASAWLRTFVSARDANKFTTLNAKDEPIQLSLKDMLAFGFKDIHGNFFNQKLIDYAVKAAKPDERAQNVLLKQLAGLEYRLFANAVKLNRQVTTTSMSVDMFARQTSMKFLDGHCAIALPHKPFVLPDCDPKTCQLVWDDFIEHFPEFPSLVKLILHARFSPDRRQCFVWLRAASSFGKGLIESLFRELGILFSVQPELIDAACTGATVGLDPSEAFRAWIMSTDEWKSAGRELKLLNRAMHVTAKYCNRVEVQLYTKIFMSAENARSLTSAGIEAQFDNRFSLVQTPDAAIDDRELFQRLGKRRYLTALVHYVGEYLNTEVAKMQALGSDKAAVSADQFIEAYQAERRLSAVFGSLDDTVDEIVEGARAFALKVVIALEGSSSFSTMFSPAGLGVSQSYFNYLSNHVVVGWVNADPGNPRSGRERALLIRRPVEFVRGYLDLTGYGDRSIAVKISYKLDSIVDKLNDSPQNDRDRLWYYQAEYGGERMRGRRIPIFTPAKAAAEAAAAA